jgi:hypothetical protein
MEKGREMTVDKPVPFIPPPKPGYSRSMELVELMLGVNLRDMLFIMTEQESADIIGVNKWTIHRWKNKLRNSETECRTVLENPARNSK